MLSEVWVHPGSVGKQGTPTLGLANNAQRKPKYDFLYTFLETRSRLNQIVGHKKCTTKVCVWTYKKFAFGFMIQYASNS